LAVDETSHRRTFYAIGLTLAVFAWLLLWAWAQSPYGRYLDHGDWTQIGLIGSICGALPLGQSLVPAILYVSGWLLMLAAMMLPTTMPILYVYSRLISRRRDRGVLFGLVISGYLAAWLAFGVAAHLADLALASAVQKVDWLVLNGWAIGAVVLAGAGLYQFSELKRRCLDKCRMPLGFVMEHWRGRAERRDAIRLGWRHGLFCVGCCWTLMLLMFVVGTGNVGWMLVLGTLMAVEKNFSWGRRISTPLGLGLLAWSFGILIVNGPHL
jgi:predicted metal-binding membrane protein